MTTISSGVSPRVSAPANDVPLEPDHELPTVKPYKPSVGGWIGTALGGAAGGVVGLAAGGIIGLASELRGSGTIGAALPIILGVAGLAIGGIGTYSFNKSNYEQRSEAALQAEHGTSTLEYARRMMSSFDHNDNGQIDLENTTGLASQDERVFTEQRDQSRSHPKYDWFNEEWRTEREYWTESRGTSAAPVWTAADTDPTDQVVTDTELARLMSQYDADENGALTTAEQDAFRAAHPMIVDSWQR